jgi:hypothetical protein
MLVALVSTGMILSLQFLVARSTRRENSGYTVAKRRRQCSRDSGSQENMFAGIFLYVQRIANVILQLMYGGV